MPSGVFRGQHSAGLCSCDEVLKAWSPILAVAKIPPCCRCADRLELIRVVDSPPSLKQGTTLARAKLPVLSVHVCTGQDVAQRTDPLLGREAVRPLRFAAGMPAQQVKDTILATEASGFGSSSHYAAAPQAGYR